MPTLAGKVALALAGGLGFCWMGDLGCSVAGLYDGYLVKENHLSLVNPERLPELIQQARASHPDLALVVEADSLELAMGLLLLPVDRILVDNLTADQVREIVNVKRSRSLGLSLIHI